jgi:hypothetical protein
LYITFNCSTFVKNLKMEKIKIIFLDVDGVLNVIPQGFDEFGGIFHPQFVDNLTHVIEMTEAKIVVSSSWRQSGLDFIKNMWEKRGYPGEVIDVTPSLYLKRGGCIVFYNDKLQRHPTESVGGYSIPRGCEIEYWLDHESEKFGFVENFVILDDDTDFLYSQRNNLVITYKNHSHKDAIDFGYGLTKKCAEKAIKILNNNNLK